MAINEDRVFWGLSSSFLRFLVTGAIAAFANFVSRIWLSNFFSYELAIVIAYLVGMTIAYMLARIFVFAPSGQTKSHEYIRFGIVNGFALVQIWLVSVGLVRIAFPEAGFDWYAESVAHGIALASTTITSYLGHKHFSFRPKDVTL